MIPLILLIAFACVASAKIQWIELEGYTFEKYIQEYNKQYTTKEEYLYRQTLFEESLSIIQKHNTEKHAWKMGVNHLSDHSEAEFKQLLGYKPSFGVMQGSVKVGGDSVSLKDLPDSVDWREKGIISPVKDQGKCGSCWAFASSAMVESHWALNTGYLHVLSEQQILDCTPNPNNCGGTGGCGGGTPELAFEKIIEMGGLSSEWTYPYISYPGKDFQCHFNASVTPAVAKISNYTVLSSNTYDTVMYHLATVGPLAVNVDASLWRRYDSGVFTQCDSVNPDINHVVQLVGYGTDSTYGPYWLVRNSWSPNFGEVGYIRISRNSSPPCGLDKYPQDGTGCDGGPESVLVCGECGMLYDVSYPGVKVAK